MLKEIYIRGFKCLKSEKISFSNLNIITGPNSSGKSSLIQAILFNLTTNIPYCDHNQEIKEYLNKLGNFVNLANFYDEYDSINIDIMMNNDKKFCYEMHSRPSKNINILLDKEGYFYSYLSAHRKSLEENYGGQDSVNYCGINGQFISGYYYANKNRPIESNLIHPESVALDNLEAQVNYWLSYICGISNLSLFVDKNSDTSYRSYYKISGQEYTPQNLGSGVSYLVAIISKSLLMSKENETLIIENPEIHLHPSSQAKLGEFFAFVAKTGRQIIIETHSEHLINKLCYCVFKKQINSSNIVLYYKQPEHFEKIEILDSGKLKNESGENQFPEGFFDATLTDMLQINLYNG